MTTDQTEKAACDALTSAGFVLLPGRWWRLPSPDYDVTETEMEIIKQLVWTYSYPGIEPRSMRQGAAAFRAGLPRGANPFQHTFDGGTPRRDWFWGWDIEQSLAPSLTKKTFSFVDSHGHDVTGTEATAGYTFQDFFTCAIDTATEAELAETYKGPDCEGIGVRWG